MIQAKEAVSNNLSGTQSHYLDLSTRRRYAAHYLNRTRRSYAAHNHSAAHHNIDAQKVRGTKDSAA